MARQVLNVQKYPDMRHGRAAAAPMMPPGGRCRSRWAFVSQQP